MAHTKTASPPLEAFVDESIRLSIRAGYNPTAFVGMRGRHGTLEAMERIVKSGEIQSGFKRLKELGLAQEWSVEAGILRFDAEFSNDAIECASWRLKQLDGA